jgi:hypothetical protein
MDLSIMNIEVPKIALDRFPAFIRVPRSGSRCPISNLTRTAIDKLTRAQPDNDFRPPVKSRVLKARGATRGVRLVEVQSLLNYLEDALHDDQLPKQVLGAWRSPIG